VQAAQNAGFEAARAASSLPVGTVIAFWGSPQEALAQKVNGWWIADGTPVTDAQSTWNGKATPKLTGYFLRGAISIGNPGGADSFTIPDQPITSHTTGGFGAPMVHGPPETHMKGGPEAFSDESSLCSKGSWLHQDVPTIPAFYPVIYLIKVR
jgi:hypothetical protein